MSEAAPSFTPSWIAPLDAVRSSVLRAVGRPGRRFLADRSARVALYGSLAVLTALLATALAPLWLLAVGPIVLGVPHLLADARYLVVRQGLQRRPGFWLLIGAPLAVTFAEPHAATAFVAVLGAVVLARGSYLRRALVLGPALALAFLAARWTSTADVVMAHAHNLIALALFWAWAPRRGGWRCVPLVLFALAGLFVLGGAFDDSVRVHLWAPGSGVTLGAMVRALSPVRDPAWGLRLVLFFAFAQSVHYAVWLRLVPEEDRPRPGIRSFASSLRMLAADVGWPLLVLCAVSVVALTAWAAADAHPARLAYLRVALFHGPLEIAVAALLFIERRPLKPA